MPPGETATIGPQTRPDTRVLPSWLPIAAALAPAGGPGAQADLQLLQDLQQRGFSLLQRRRFYIPLIMKRERAVSAEKFLANIDGPRSRMAVPKGDPIPFSRADLPTLHALYGAVGVASLAHPTTAASLLGLERGGWRFKVDGCEAGAFGAYRSLASSTPSAAASDGQGAPASLTRLEDPARLRFFRGDGVDTGLSAPTEASGLRKLATCGPP